MFTVLITEKGGTQKRLSFEEPEVTIGRVPGNDVVLPKGNVSKRHSRIVLKDSRFIVVDLKSTNGTYVNGRKITSPLVVKEGDKIYIGDFILTLEGDPAMQAPSEAMRPPSMLPNAEDGPATSMNGQAQDALTSAVSAAPPLPSRGPEPLSDDLPPVLRRAISGSPHPSSSPPSEPGTSAGPAPSLPPVIAGVDDTGRPQAPSDAPGGLMSEAYGLGSEPPSNTSPPQPGVPSYAKPIARAMARSLPPVLSSQRSSIPPDIQQDVRSLMTRLSRELDVDNADPAALADEKRWQKAERVIQGKLGELTSDGTIGRSIDKNAVVQAVLHEAVGLGALDTLIDDPEVFHIVVERFDRVRADRGNGLTLENLSFSSPQALLTALRRLSAHAGVREDAPLIDFTLVQGLHVVAILASATSDGPVASLRRRPGKGATLADLKTDDAFDAGQAKQFTDMLEARKNVFVVGASQRPLATFVSALVGGCEQNERITLLERTPELFLGERSAVCLRRGMTDLSKLVEGARHFGTSRLVIHDLASAELVDALPVLSAHRDGSITSFVGRNVEGAIAEVAEIARAPGGIGLEAARLALGSIVEVTQVAAGKLHVGHLFEAHVADNTLKLRRQA
jgi:pilus assembly protein CpaF